MLLYHGSSKELGSLKPHQAGGPEDRGKVPEGELLHAIYLTPEFDFAFAMAARPPGVTEIDNRKITFEHPELFDPNKEVYVYEIDTEGLSESQLSKIDELQYVIEGLEELKPTKTHKLHSGEILNYYELTNWKETDETKRESTEIDRKQRR